MKCGNKEAERAMCLSKLCRPRASLSFLCLLQLFFVDILETKALFVVLSCKSISVSACLLACLSVCVSMSVCLPVYVPLCLVCLSVCLFSCLSLGLFVLQVHTRVSSCEYLKLMNYWENFCELSSFVFLSPSSPPFLTTPPSHLPFPLFSRVTSFSFLIFLLFFFHDSLRPHLSLFLHGLLRSHLTSSPSYLTTSSFIPPPPRLQQLVVLPSNRPGSY